MENGITAFEKYHASDSFIKALQIGGFVAEKQWQSSVEPVFTAAKERLVYRPAISLSVDLYHSARRIFRTPFRHAA